MVNPIGPAGNQPIKFQGRVPCTHDETCPKDARNMPGHRHRTRTGRLMQKRSDTKLSSLEKQYGEISCRDGNTTLKELRQLTGEVGINKVRKKLHEIETVEIPENKFPGMKGDLKFLTE